MIRNLLFDRETLQSAALIAEDGQRTYLELINQAKKICAAFPKRRKGCVAILLPDGAEFIAALWAVIGSGEIAFPLNTLLTLNELFPLLLKTDAKAVITSSAYRKKLEDYCELKDLAIKIISIEEEVENNNSKKFRQRKVNPDKPMLYLNTSGTTDNCKIAVLSEKNIHLSLCGYLQRVAFDDIERKNARVFLAVPFCSIYGIMVLSACLRENIPIVQLSRDFSLENLFFLTEKHRVTHYEGSSGFLILLERLIEKDIPYDISSLKYIAFGGSKVYKSTMESLQSKFSYVSFCQGYGMTETGPLVAKQHSRRVKNAESVGRAISGVNLFVSTTEGLTCLPFIEGEIVVSGGNIMLGYLNNKAETEKIIKSGLLYTGDLGYFDEEGYLYICGRLKNLINIRGLKVCPEEVEECIQASGLATECVVYGEIDEYRNELVCADIIPADESVSSDEIRNYCREHLAEFKLPEKIVFCKDIKKNLNDKIIRKKES